MPVLVTIISKTKIKIRRLNQVLVESKSRRKRKGQRKWTQQRKRENHGMVIELRGKRKSRSQVKVSSKERILVEV